MLLLLLNYPQPSHVSRRIQPARPEATTRVILTTSSTACTIIQIKSAKTFLLLLTLSSAQSCVMEDPTNKAGSHNQADIDDIFYALYYNSDKEGQDTFVAVHVILSPVMHHRRSSNFWVESIPAPPPLNLESVSKSVCKTFLRNENTFNCKIIIS